MTKSMRIKANKFISPLIILAMILGTLVAFPSLSLSATNPTLTDTGDTVYLLGEWLQFTATVTNDGSLDADSVTLEVTGTQAFTSPALPITDVTNATYDTDSDGNVDLIVTVDATTSAPDILYTILWQPPYMLATYDAELPEADFAWDISDYAGTVTDMASNTKPQGLASDGTNLFILVDGTSNDKIILTQTDGTYVTSFDAPNGKALSIVYYNDYLYVYCDDYTKTLAVEDETPTYEEYAWNYKYKLGIYNDWNQQMVEGSLVVTRDGVEVTPTNIDINGAFDLPEETPWDNQNVQGPTVVKVSSTYHMYYYSDGGDGSVTGEQIGHATSTDGINWTKDAANNPVLEPGTTGWDAGGVMHPSVRYDDDTSTYHLWYTGHNGTGTHQIGHATSTDGATWTKDGSNPVLQPSATSDDWDSREILEADVISTTTGYTMWFTASNENTWIRKVGRATYITDDPTDPDYLTWVKYDDGLATGDDTGKDDEWGNDILEPASENNTDPVMSSSMGWDNGGIYSPSVVKSGSTYHMWYEGENDWDGNRAICYASSTDGIEWEKLNDWYDPTDPDAATNPLIQQSWCWGEWDDQDVGAPDVISEGGGFTMWYEGVMRQWDDDAMADLDYTSIGRSTSPSSGTNWVQDEDNPVLEEGAESAVILCSYSYMDGWADNSIVKISPVDGTYQEHWSFWNGKVGGLSTDESSTLYGCSPEWDDLWEIDPDDGTVSFTQKPWSTDVSLTTQYWFQGGDALAYRDGNLYAADSDIIHVVDTLTGEILEVFAPIVNAANDESLESIRGLTFIGDTSTSNTVYIACFDSTNDGRIFTSNLVGTVDKGASGSYTAVLDVDGTDSTGIDFDLEELTESVQVTITDPLEGDAFFTGESVITISGIVNDPSVPAVLVGVETTMGALINDGAESGDSDTGTGSFQKLDVLGSEHESPWGDTYGTDNLWRITDERAYSGNYSWGYNQTSGDWVNFDTSPNANAGAIVSDSFYVGSECDLSFMTSWNTDPWTEVDRKLIDISIDGGTTWENLAYIADGDWYPDWYGGSRQLIIVPQSFPGGGDPMMMGGWNWAQANIDLSEDYEGETAQIRFRFDSCDAWMNDGEGWYIDDVTITGSDLDSVTAEVGDYDDTLGGFAWEADFTLLEGFNEIIASATSGYISGTTGTDTDTVTVSYDNSTPVVQLSVEDTFTNQATVDVIGTVYELNFTSMVLTLLTETAADAGDDPTTLTTVTEIPDAQEPPYWTFTQTVALAEGDNVIAATVTDENGLEGTTSITVIRDATGPTVTALATSYPTGEVSARIGDLFILQIDATDASAGVATVEIQMPGDGNEWENFMPATELPNAIIQQWGTTGSYVFPMEVPSDAPPGNYNFNVKVTDNAGNETSTTITALLTATLSAYNIYLMPEWNFISLPLIPDDDDITTLLGSVTGVEKVWYYDAATATWQVYNTDPAIPSDLTTMETGKGYWVYMDEAVYTYSDPIMPGLPNTPTPIKFSYEGQVLEPATVPPTYAVVEGWNAVGLHSEWEKAVSTYLRPVGGSWATLLQYDNYISFEKGEEPEEGDEDDSSNIEIFLGSYRTVLDDGYMQPGTGYWLYQMADGNLVAQP